MRFLVLNSDAERRDGLKTLLRQIDRHAGYNDAKDWRQAQRLIKQQSFDLITVDWRDIERLGDLHAFCKACSPTPVAALTDDASPEQTRALFAAGVLGVIPRSTRPHLIVRALEIVLLGSYYVPPSALNLAEPSARASDSRADSLACQLPARKRSPCSLLSPRQAQIMRFVHMGSTNKMIARTLGISEGTVKIHLASIFQQLGANNRASAVAIYNGWLPPHLEVLLASNESSPKPVHGAPGPVPLRAVKTQHKYPLAAENESTSEPLIAAELPTPYKANE
ncbi:helix-turn-helix transcriptional regulator [Burkholderia singularis]|uniref:Helix-turn-helix transcriptional regulator n=1 Tax=Burkholderia singularis TaxID=1503053 RepID=A0A124P9W6_9BURK|nr:response regulator transcription factor [Burkholderia singularis]KVE29797.1 helix-turn-helix transcriptional regulator [Burkholderia singularis]